MTRQRYRWMLDRVRVSLAGRPLHDASVPSPFFIVGSGRSGNTLLRAMLEAGDEVSIPPETYVLGEVIKKWKRFSRLPWDDVLHICLGTLEHYPEFDKFPSPLRPTFLRLNALPEAERSLARVLHQFYADYARETKPSATRFGDKTPYNHTCLEDLVEVFPDARFIHMVRDGRDVARSYVKMGRYATWEGAADRWLEATDTVMAFARKHPRAVLRLRYEDLVSDTDTVLRDVCRFLSVAFDPRMLSHEESLSDLGDVQRIAHHAGVTSGVNTDSVGRWREFFDDEQAAALNRRLGARLSELGYP